MAVARVTEISSTSTTSFEDAIKSGLERANQTLRNVRSAWIKEQQVRLDGGSISEYQVNMLVTFVSRRLKQNPALVTLITVGVWTVGGLWLDSQVGHTGQLFLGLLTVGVLAGLLALQAPSVRVQTLGVVCVATVGEVIGSLIWGLYTYRLDNLPTFVPPGHGLVYLAGVSLAALCGRRALVTVACVAAARVGRGRARVATRPRCRRRDRLRVPHRRPAPDPPARCTPGSSSSSPRSSCTEPPSGRGRGPRPFRGSGSPRAILRAASRAATSSSTSSCCR